jgi:hypothetical protein
MQIFKQVVLYILLLFSEPDRSVIFSGSSGFLSSINKTDRHDVTEILLKVALNTIKQSKQTKYGT